MFPKLPIERKGVWPRLIRWNGVTPGRQCTCWCEAVWGGKGDGVGEVPAFFPCEISELSLLCTHIKLYMCEGVCVCGCEGEGVQGRV